MKDLQTKLEGLTAKKQFDEWLLENWDNFLEETRKVVESFPPSTSPHEGIPPHILHHPVFEPIDNPPHLKGWTRIRLEPNGPPPDRDEIEND